jgi:hypothetical protein
MSSVFPNVGQLEVNLFHLNRPEIKKKHASLPEMVVSKISRSSPSSSSFAYRYWMLIKPLGKIIKKKQSNLHCYTLHFFLPAVRRRQAPAVARLPKMLSRYSKSHLFQRFFFFVIFKSLNCPRLSTIFQECYITVLGLLHSQLHCASTEIREHVNLFSVEFPELWLDY